jgi:hypothetical protein
MAGMWGAVSITPKDKKTPDNLKDYDHNLWLPGIKPLFPNIENNIINWKVQGYRSDEMFLLKYIVPTFKGRKNSHMAGCGIDPTPFQFISLEENGGITYKYKDIKLKNDEDRTSYVKMEYDLNKLPKKQDFKEIMITDIIKGGRIGDPIESDVESFKRKNLYEFFVKKNQTKSKTCRWFMYY